ncbi:MAG: Rieske (2Fe-2S) protein [Nitrososphaerales archaeon]
MGRLSDAVITCPLHQARFDLRNGGVLEGQNGTDPNTISSLRTYPVRVENDEIWAGV